MVRGMIGYDTGAPIMVPVGPTTLGRLINVIGQPIDGKGPVETDKHYPIHRPAPEFKTLSTSTEMLETWYQSDCF